MLLLHALTLLERRDNMKKKIINLFSIIVLLFSFLVPVSVSASDSYTFVFPEEPYIYNIGGSWTAENIAAEIYDNSSLSSLGYYASNSYFFVDYNPGTAIADFYVVFADDLNYNSVAKFYFNGAYVQFPFLLFVKGAKCTSSLTSVSSATFTQFNSVQSGNPTSYGIGKTSVISSAYNPYLVGPYYYDSYYGHYSSLVVNNSRGCCFGTYILPPFNPDTGFYQYYYNGVQLAYDIDDFYTWIVNNNKLVELPSYIVQSKLLSFLDFYKNYGGSASSFFRFVPDWFDYMNIGSQTNDNINILKASIDNLYREYLTYVSNNHAYWPGAVKLEKRNEIDTVTDNDHQTLVTDKQTDDDITLILRDILRGVIAIPNQLYTVGQNIINSINQLDFTVNVSNDGGVIVPTGDNNIDIDYTDQGDFEIDKIHQYPMQLPTAPDIDNSIDFLDYPYVLASASTQFLSMLPQNLSALLSGVVVLGVLLSKIGR